MEAGLEAAIRANHGVSAKHVVATYVREDSQGETVWDGDVHIFELIDHATAERCYAWKYETDDGRWLVATVLGVPPIYSARDAVRTYMASGHDAGPG